MNKAILKGRITKDLVLRYTNNNTEVLNFTLAVNRDYKNANNEYATDFINCIAFKNNATFIKNHFEKGSEIIVEGKIQTGSYDNKDGVKVYTSDVAVDRVEFCGSKKVSNEIIPSDFEKEEINPFADYGAEVKIDDDFLE